MAFLYEVATRCLTALGITVGIMITTILLAFIISKEYRKSIMEVLESYNGPPELIFLLSLLRRSLSNV